MKTIEEWNAEQVAKFREPKFLPLQEEKKPMGVSCECGGEIFIHTLTFYGFRPSHQGVECHGCGRTGHIDENMGLSPKTLVMHDRDH
jgi:hypothetical protein